MKRGVVLELQAEVAVVLETNGTFRTIPYLPGWRVGDVVRLPAQRGHAPVFAALAACLALLLCGGWVAGLWFTQTSLVSLDVNPSLELRLNCFDRVISARALNADGTRLLSAAVVTGLSCGDAISALLGEGRDYLTADANVSLTVQADSQRQEAVLLSQLDGSARSAAAGLATAVECHEVDAALVAEAHSHGVTAGKYLALLELQEADPQIDIGRYAHCGLGEIKSEAQRCRDAIQEDAAGTPEGGRQGRPGQAGGHHGTNHHRSSIRFIRADP